MHKEDGVEGAQAERSEENVSGDEREKNVQEVEGQDKQEHKYPWKKVERRKQTDKKKTPIIICGDSMVKEINKNISMKEERSELCCMRGANIER